MNRLVEEELERQEEQTFKGWNSNSTGILKDIKSLLFFTREDWAQDTAKQIAQRGKKETEGKLYYELSWEFIEEIAKRMANNKGEKYELYNWKQPMTPKGIEDLKQAINRHHIEVMKSNYKDGEEALGHIVSYACNAMMLWEQLKNNK